MPKNPWIRADRIIRWIHLYTGLFLVPWMLVYAASAFCLNHRAWITQHFNIKPPQWKLLREVDFVPGDAFPHVPAEQARAILQQLDLDGAHVIQGQPNQNQMNIIRICGSGNYRIIWRRHRSVVTVEQQQPFSYLRLLHFLHFRGGHAQPYFAHIVWAVLVDLVAVSILAWVITGIYLWWRRSRKVLLGWTCVIAGGLLFAVLVIIFCR